MWFEFSVTGVVKRTSTALRVSEEINACQESKPFQH